MTKRKAKKKVKKAWRIGRWPGNLEPRILELYLRYTSECMAAALEAAVLYGREATHTQGAEPRGLRQ